MKKSIFKEGKKYTFSDYFEFSNPTDEIVEELGYSLIIAKLSLPKDIQFRKDITEKLRQSYYELLPKITINSETAKREFMIAPVLHEVIRELDNIKLNIEYPIDVNEKLSGSVDYLLYCEQELIVIEAKKGDLDRGFTQLAAQLIALDQYEESGYNTLYGAVTIGEVWRFAILDRNTKKITKDIHIFRFPEDIEDIFGILKGIFTIKPAGIGAE